MSAAAALSVTGPALLSSAAALRRRAAQCLRFADQLDGGADPAAPALRALAQEYEAAAEACEAQPHRGPVDAPRPRAR